MLRASYEQPAERARAVGVWGAVAGIGAASGPVLGGVLSGWSAGARYSTSTSRSGLAALVLAARHLPADRRVNARGFDPPGQALGILALTLVTFGLIEGGAAGWGTPLALVPLIAFVPAVVAFVVVERRACRPMLPLSLFGSRTFSGASFVGLAINLGFYGQLFAIALYFQHVRGFSRSTPGSRCFPREFRGARIGAVRARTARFGPARADAGRPRLRGRGIRRA